MKRVWRAAGLLAMVATLTGCAAQGPLKAYEGPVRAPSELVRVNVPEQIEVMSIDGREPPPSFLRSRVQLALLPGEHVLSLRYVQLFQINADEHDVIRSRQAALRFRAAAGEEYRLEMPPQPNREAARVFAKQPRFTLVNVQNGGRTESTPIQSYAEAALIDSLQKAFTTQGETAPPTNLDLLKDVWGRSSPEERQAFRRWLDRQEQP